MSRLVYTKMNADRDEGEAVERRERKRFRLGRVEVEDTYAEAFRAAATRVIITAETARWARIAAVEATGYGTSVIGCDAEAGIERELTTAETPDGRPGVSVLLFTFKKERLKEAVRNRVGQCVLTCPTTACYNGLPAESQEETIEVGRYVSFFGDGFQTQRSAHGRTVWCVPVMDGEFVCEERVGVVQAVAGGNLLLCGRDRASTLKAAETAVKAIEPLPEVVTPFPGGIVRSGSKVGSQSYSNLKATTNDAFCPTLRTRTRSLLPQGVEAVYEIVVNGLNEQAVRRALQAALHAVADCSGLVLVTAGNYNGRLGRIHFHLRELV